MVPSYSTDLKKEPLSSSVESSESKLGKQVARSPLRNAVQSYLNE